MKIKFLFIALLITVGVTAQKFEKDKQSHFFAGMTVGGVIYEMSRDTDHAFLYTVGTTAAVGTLKEVFDSRYSTTGFDTWDLMYTTAGGLVSYLLGEYLGINGGITGIVGITGLYVRLNF